MKNSDTQKIRQLLKLILEIFQQPTPKRGFGGYIFEIDADDKNLIVGSILQALALFPCETCGSSKKVGTGIGEDGQDFDMRSPEILEPCLDCQS